MICSICKRKIPDHTVAEAEECSRQFALVELERTANKLCISCGCPSDMMDPNTNEYWCHSCMMWSSQLNDER